MHDNIDPLLLTGQLAVRQGNVTEKQLHSALCNTDGGRIGEKLIKARAIGREALETLIRARDDSSVSIKDTVLGELAVRNGLVSREELETCLAIQEDARAKGKTVPRLGEILTSTGYLQELDIEALLNRQGSLLATLVNQPETGTVFDDEAPDFTLSGVAVPGMPGADETEFEKVLVDEPTRRSGDNYFNVSGSRKGLVGLLFPEPVSPVACQTCKSAANSPLVLVCASCGNPVLADDSGLKKVAPWGLRAAFVVLAGLTGFAALRAGPYVIGAVMFLMFSARMLRNYKPARMYFLVTGTLVMAGFYVMTDGAFGPLVDTLFGASRQSRNIWDFGSGTASIVAAICLFTLASPLGLSRSRGICGALLLLLLALTISWQVAWSGSQNEWLAEWKFIAVCCTGGLLALMLLALALLDGFQVTTVRPRMIIEAKRPWPKPDRPIRSTRNMREIPMIARPVFTVYDTMVWSMRLSIHHLSCSLVFFCNSVVYWSQLAIDLLLRLLVRAWRRLLALSKTLISVAVGIVVFTWYAAYRVVLVILLPVVAIGASAWVCKSLADTTLVYVFQGGWANLASATLYAAMFSLLAIVTVGLLVRCHPSNVVVREAFQGLSYHLQNFLLLLYATSILLSLLCWITKTEPFHFGPLSMLLTVLLVGLFVSVIRRSKKKHTGNPGVTPDDCPVPEVEQNVDGGVAIEAHDERTLQTEE